MKNRRVFTGIAVVILVIVGLLLNNNFIFTKNMFNGSRVRNPDGYYLDFSYMNQDDTCELTLQEGDALHAKWTIEKGDVSIQVEDPDGQVIYQGDQIDTADFDLGIQKSGTYEIYVYARKAKGKIQLEIKK